jgi:hypothetical protein
MSWTAVCVSTLTVQRVTTLRDDQEFQFMLAQA